MWDNSKTEASNTDLLCRFPRHSIVKCLSRCLKLSLILAFWRSSSLLCPKKVWEITQTTNISNTPSSRFLGNLIQRSFKNLCFWILILKQISWTFHLIIFFWIEANFGDSVTKLRLLCLNNWTKSNFFYYFKTNSFFDYLLNEAIEKYRGQTSIILDYNKRIPSKKFQNFLEPKFQSIGWVDIAWVSVYTPKNCFWTFLLVAFKFEKVALII
jgi:hypothetical protein